MLKHCDFQEVHFYTSVGVVALDENGIIVYSNPQFRQFISEELHLGNPVSYFFKQDENINRVSDLWHGKLLKDAEYCLTSATDNKTVLVNSTTYNDGTETLLYLFIRNITSLKKKERLYAYLNSAAEALVSARDTDTALSQISRVIVPKFANWFSIDLYQDSQIKELVLAHEDPDMIEWARKYREAYPTDMTSNSGLADVLKNGNTSLVSVITDEMILASTTDDEKLYLIQRMNLRSILIVPIIHKTITKGAITFVSSKQGVHYDEIDLEFAESFATHIGITLENARLNEAAEAEIAQRKEIERELRITQVQLKSALSSGLVGTWITDLETDIVYMDENLSRMYGVPFLPNGSRQDIINSAIHPDDLKLLQPQNRNTLEEGGVYESEFRVIREGATHWFFARGSMEANGQGKLFGGVVIDITERKVAELGLKESENRFRFIADAIPHKLWTSNPDGRANYYNQVWYDYTGVHDFDKLKSSAWDFIHPDDKALLEVEWPQAIARGETKSFEHRLRRHDGEFRWHLSRFSAHRDETGEIVLWVGTSTDIEEQKENEQRKDEFLSIASHELKTPLTSIKAFNQIMARSTVDGKLKKFINKSAEHIYRLERLIADLLDVTKINAGKLHYSFEDLAFHKVISYAKENFQYSGKHKIIIQNSAKAIIKGDRFRLEQVLDNLIANAIKYSPDADRVLINSFIEDHNLIVSVQDFGIGIESEKLDRLFERYYRVDNTAMRFEGLGLGLYISSEILKRHNGSFWIESELGKGSTFFIRLPLAEERPERILKNTKNFYADDLVSIRHNKSKKRLEVHWKGFQDQNTVKKTCLIMLDFLKYHSLSMVINDNTQVKGNWSDAVDWVGCIWFPMMEKAGLKYFAHVLSPNTFGQLAAKKSIDIMAVKVETQYFNDFSLAEEWLDEIFRKEN